MADQHPDPYHAGDRFLEAAGALGLDLSHFWGVVEHDRTDGFSQALLAIVGSGRTAMLFLSPPPHPKGLWRPTSGAQAATVAAVRDRAERVALVHHALYELARIDAGRPGDPSGVVLAQALIEPPSYAVVQAFQEAGFTRLGDLAYFRLDATKLWNAAGRSEEGPWPEGVEVLSVEAMDDARADEELKLALERTYEGTLDCPELCGMRSIEDVLISHRSVGQFDPKLWWIVRKNHEPAGCLLLSPVRETDSVELVYLGLGTQLRGLGLGRGLMRMGMRSLHERTRSGESDAQMGPLSGGLTLAVDLRNHPAVKLYRSLGFVRTGTRIPLVRALNAGDLAV